MLLSNTEGQRSQAHLCKKRRKVAVIPASLHPPSCHFSVPRATVPAGKSSLHQRRKKRAGDQPRHLQGHHRKAPLWFHPAQSCKAERHGDSRLGDRAASGGSDGGHSDLLPSSPAGEPTEAAGGCAKQSPADSTSFCHRYSHSLIPAARVPPSSPAPWDLPRGVEYICPHQSLNTVSIAAFFMTGSNGGALQEVNR